MKASQHTSRANLATFRALVLFLLCASNLAWSATGSVGCGQSLTSSKPVPLSGLWELHSYKEITGNKAYFQAGDYVLIEPTDVPGQACVEFSSFVEGNFYYYVAMDEAGMTIDDTIITELGKSLRIVVQRVADGVSVVLYTTTSGSGALEGGEEDGGGVAGGNRP